MTDYYVIYRDVESEARRQTFEKMEPPEYGSRVLDQVIPSQSGVRPIQVRWHHRQFGSDTLHLVTYTHHDLAGRDVKDLVQQAYNLTQERN